VNSNTLELITHKYWLETGNETLFPTDVYIQAQLGNTHYQESGKSVRKLWEMRYNTPQEFKSLRELQVARKDAANFFPQSAIVHYRNAKGNYVLSVKRPVEQANYDKDNFFDEFDNIGSMRDVKKLNLGIRENQTYTISKVQELYNRFNDDRTSKVLADKVFSIAKDLGIEVSFNESLPFGTIGRYTNSNTITYKKSFLERDIMNNMKASIILHEVLHSISMYALSNQTKNWKRPEALQEFRTEINSLYQDLKTNPILKGERGIVDIFEFVAELANPVFRGKIQEIDKQNKANKSFWSRVLDAFKSLLGLHTSNTYYQRSMNALDKALNAFDIDTYMRYNGIKSQLRKEVANNTTNLQNQRYNNKSTEQLDKSLDTIRSVIESGKWTSESLTVLDNLIKDIENGKVTYKRFPQEASGGMYKGGTTNATASILLSSNESSSRNAPLSVSERYERDKRQQPIQERIVESWAKAKGIWHDNLDTIEGKELFAEGGEAKVFANDGDTNVIKILSTEYFITPQFALDRITLHNTLFPEATLKITGFGRNSKGEFQFLVEQPFIQGTYATQAEIDKFITKAGFTKSTKDKGNTFITDDLYVSDLHDENVIKTPNGNLIIIDADIRLNTPELNRNGKYVINNDITSMQESNAKDFIYSLSKEQLDNEISLIKQESADYDLINDIEPKKEHSGKAVPQDFTFADGTTVKAPFKPNAQQIDALNEMDRFMKSNETSMTLSGYAGTGKTSLMEMIAKKGKKQHRPVMFCATTNKAAAVLNDRVSKAGFKASTLNKVFGINVEVDSSKAYNARNLVNVLKDVDIMPGTTIIIDEASMINEENYKILNDIAKKMDLKIIYVGDEAQLAPVNEDKISKVFRNGEGKVIRLTQVERTDDNAILKEATAIRNGEPLSKVSSFNSKGEGVAYISPQHQDAINEVIDKYVKGLKQNPNYFRILAYTNKAVTAYNNQVRELLGYDSPIPHVGEPMTGYANWGYEWKTKSYRFINSESYKVTQVGKPTTVQTRLDNGTPVVMQAIPLTLEDSLGNIDTFDFMDIKNNAQNRQSAMILANEKKRLWNEARRAYGREAKAAIYAKINAIDSFLFVNDNIEDNSHNLLQAKTIDFGYALTIHKSQGSTFTHVLMDDVDVSRASMSDNNAANAMEMVDLGEESKNDAANAELKSSEEVDLGDLSDVEVEGTQPDQAANIKQQLEYVGVSRATDTVTIISNNVKKEGSPLEINKKAQNNKINPDSQRSNNETSSLPFSPKDATFYSGGAVGSDKAWEEAATKAGIKVQNYTVKDWDNLSNEWKTKLDKEYQEIVNTLGRRVLDINSYSGKLVRRDMMQADKADAIFAIGTIASNGYVNGGTGYASTRGIIRDIPVYLFDQKDSTWKVWDKATKKFVPTSQPSLTKNAAVIGTRGLQENGKKAIESLFNSNNNLRSENKNSKENGTEEYKTTDEFRRVQEAVRKGSQGQRKSIYDGDLSTDQRQHLADVLRRQLGSIDSFIHGSSRTVSNQKHGTSFNIHSEVSPKLFHDIFEIVRYYTKNAELVDLHDDYSEAKCYLTEDGTAGFAVEPNGNLVSVFNLGTSKGFLSAIKDLVREAGATHLDAYASNKQNLELMYEKTLGFHTAATMDYNMEYDHDNIAKNHGNPQVVFMVDHEVAEPKHFDKDSYDAAQQYQLQQLEESETEVTNPSFPEGQTQKVSLPGYEYFNELYDETPVDAAWKIPYLKELDAQLSMENSFEENQNIINQMDTVLQATSEKEYLQESKDSQKKEVETNLSEYDKLNKQIDNLLNGDKDLEELGASLSATEVRHTAELIVNSISDEITNLQKEKGLAKTLFPSLNTDLDFQSASRKQIVETVGLDRLIERTKILFSPQVMDYEDTDTMMQAQLITDNWDAIMYLAADIFAMNEGFGITKDYSRGNFTTTEDSKVDFDNFNDYSNDQDIAAEEGEKDEQEHWQVESRTIDVLNSMSALVRLGLHECYLLDAEGNKVYSKWGIAERVNPRESVNSILRWTQGALSLDDMIKRLSDKQKQNPWLSQLIQRLSDKSGKETDFQSQFYGVFSKHFQLYSIVLLEDGKYYSMTVNSHPALSEAMKSISALFKIGEHPLFGNNGKINSKLLGTDQTTGKNSEFNLHKALTELREIDKAIKEGKTLDDTMSKTATDNILGISKSFGYNITEEMLTDVVNAENIKKITESLGYIVKDLDKALQAQNKGTLKEYDPFKFGTENSIGGSLRNLLTPITDKLEDTAVNAFYDSGKMYQSYITPSFMTKLMNKFRQEGQAFEDFIMNEYGSSEWFKFQNGDVDKGWRNEWLRILAKDEDARKVFDHKVELNFNKHNYMRNMSDAEYTLSLITEYFAESTDDSTNMVPAWFRVPMQSNKPSSEFIKFYSYRGEGYKNSIVYGLHNMFLQELSRIQTVRMRNMDKKDAGFIKNFDTNGRRFNFLPVLNNYLENTADKIAKRDILRNEDNTISSDNSRLASLLQKKVEGEVAPTAEEEAELG
jgi:hypothetical protein